MVRRTTWFYLIVFAVLLGATLVWQRSQGNKANEAQATATPRPEFIPGVQESEVASLRLENTSGKVVVLERDANGQWLLKEPAGETDTMRASLATADLISTNVVSTLQNGPAAQDAGLDPAAATATLTLKSGRAVTVRIGKLTPIGSGYYAQVDDGPMVVVDKFAADKVLALLDNPPVAPTLTPTEAAATPPVELTPSPLP